MIKMTYKINEKKRTKRIENSEGYKRKKKASYGLYSLTY